VANSTERKKAKIDRRVVSFELAEDVLELLVQDAKAHSAKSRHARARDIVVTALSQKAGDDFAQLVGELDTKVAWLKTGIQRLAYAILVYASHTDAKDANAWIREHLTN
jgi:hypothetical protein